MRPGPPTINKSSLSFITTSPLSFPRVNIWRAVVGVLARDSGGFQVCLIVCAGKAETLTIACFSDVYVPLNYFS